MSDFSPIKTKTISLGSNALISLWQEVCKELNKGFYVCTRGNVTWCDQGGLDRHDYSFLPHPAQGYKFLWLVDVLPGVFRTKPLAETGFSPERYPLWDAPPKKKQKKQKNKKTRISFPEFFLRIEMCTIYWNPQWLLVLLRPLDNRVVRRLAVRKVLRRVHFVLHPRSHLRGMMVRNL